MTKDERKEIADKSEAIENGLNKVVKLITNSSNHVSVDIFNAIQDTRRITHELRIVLAEAK